MKNRNEYYKVYMLNRYHERRTEAFSILGNQCSYCGSKENLEIDHKDWRGKSFDLSKLWNCNKDSFIEEISKCQILCRSCHVIKSKEDLREMITGSRDVPHGKLNTYKKHKCRCDDCVAAFRKYNKEYKIYKNIKINPNYVYKPRNKFCVCGTYSSYKKGCRCNLCRKANTNYQIEYRSKKLK